MTTTIAIIAVAQNSLLVNQSDDRIAVAFVLLIICIGGGLLLSLFGWQNFYNERKVFGSSLVVLGTLIGLCGLGWWWLLLWSAPL